MTDPITLTFDTYGNPGIPPPMKLSLGAALQRWREASCAEFTGDRHSYVLEVEGGQASVCCEVCRHNPLDRGDLNEFIYFGPIPVDVSVNTIIHPGGPWGGPEYDVEVEVTPR